MKDFILNLYANENFPIYLGAIIIVLLIAFFIVFFLGKKDQKKIEMTQRLDKITDDAFKEVSTPVNVTVASPIPETPTTLNTQVPQEVQEIPSVPVVDVPIQPVIETPVVEDVSVNIPTEITQSQTAIEVPSTPVINDVPAITPIVQEVKEPVIEAPVSLEIQKSNIDSDMYKSQQAIDKLPEKASVPKFNPDPVIEPYIPEPDLVNFNELASSIELELSELEKQHELAKPILENVNSEETIAPVLQETPVADVQAPIIDMPVAPKESEPVTHIEMPSIPEVQTPVLQPVQTDQIVIPTEANEPKVNSNPTKVVTDVFSSVYAPKKENQPLFDDTMAIELPKLKTDENN